MDKMEKVDQITDVISRYNESQLFSQNADHSNGDIYSELLLEMAHIARSIVIFNLYGDKFTENMLFKLYELRAEVTDADMSESLKYEMLKDINMLIRFIQIA